MPKKASSGKHCRFRQISGILAAHEKYGLLIIFQGMDAAGKDPIIKHIFSGVDPQGCETKSFKAPTEKGTPPRLSLAGGARTAGARANRHFQPLLLRTNDGRTRAPRKIGQMEFAGRSRQQRYVAADVS
jgi:hypothetical protein